MRIAAPDFNLSATLDSGQVFGFAALKQGGFGGVICGKPLRVAQDGGELVLGDEGEGLPAESALRRYFDLERDLSPVYGALAADERIAPLRAPLSGMRLVRQEPWEALASFIVSANNNVKRIRLIWRNLSVRFTGSPWRFPEPAPLAASDEKTLRGLGLGYRAPFILATARSVAADPARFLEIADLPYEDAKERLMEFPGVGPKVADCVLVYGFGRHEAFPVDVWVLRAVRKLYFRNRSVSEKRATDFGRKRWGSQCGYVQHYIYHGAKCGLI